MTAEERPAVLAVSTDDLGDGRLLVLLEGTLDTTTRHLVEVAVRATPDWAREIVIDLSLLRRIGPGGAGALALGYRQLLDSGRSVVVRAPSDEVHELLERWKLTDLVERPQSGELDLRLSRLLAAIVALDEPVVDLREERARG